MEKIIHIKTMEDFEKEVLNSEKKVIVDFWAQWCGPCKMLGPIFEKISNERDDFKFVKVEVDEAPEIANKYEIRSIPTLKIFNKNEIIDETMGALGKEQLMDFLDKNK